jgi:cytochrome c-type biogenesis protein CcmH
MIGFWILAGLAAVVTIAVIGYALVAAKGNAATAAAYDVQVYRTQLKELERDVARGVIGEDEAGRAKVEISRRLLEADRKAQAAIPDGRAPAGLTWSAVALSAAVILGGGLWAYGDLGAPGYWDMPLKGRFEAAAQARDTRPSQAEAEADLPDWAGPPPEAPADYVELVEKLRAAVAERPDEMQGLTLLAQHEGALGNYRAAHGALAKLIALKGDSATAEDYSQYADLLVLAARGYVSPEAEQAATQALRRNPRDQVALYYAGLMNAQTGRPDVAFGIWRDLLEASDPSEPWVAPILAEIGQLAALAGVDYTPPELQSTISGPSAADIAAAEDMSPEDRAAMIDSMVKGLMDRLATQGGSAQDWARLIGALGVQGDMDRASAIWGEARSVFAARPDDLALIDQAAANAGLTEALPFTPPVAGQAPALAGPSQDDMEAAAEMSTEDRADMINSMVTRLEDELLTDGGAPERWVQLFNVLGVLGDTDRAKAAWSAAQAAFGDDAAALDAIRGAAAAVGATE